MRIKSLVFGLAVIFISLPLRMRALDEKQAVSIRILLYKAALTGEGSLNQVAVYSPSSNPQLAFLRDKIGGPEPELKAALNETLLDLFDLESLDGLGFFEKPWPGKEKTLEWRLADNRVGFLYRFEPRWISRGKLAIRMAFLVSKVVPLREGMKRDDELRKILEVTSDEREMEPILEKELVLEQNEPLIVGIPYKGQAYIVIASWTNAIPGKAPEAPMKAGAPRDTAVSGVPTPVHQVNPAYPNELRQQGVRGEVKLRLSIDEKGEVTGVTVVKPLHPYLDYAAVQALLHWEFAPFLKSGKAVPVTTVFTFDFDPGKYALIEQSAGTDEGYLAGTESAAQDALQRILAECAEYCQKLDNAALYFVCEEKIKEIHGYFDTGRRGWILTSETEGYGRDRDGGKVFQGTYSRYRVIEPDRTERNQYVCDYQLVRKDGRIQERRIILKKNGRETQDPKRYLDDRHYSVLMPIFAAVQLLSRDRQPQFHFRLLHMDKAAGKEAYVIEAVPRLKNAGSVERAEIWVDKVGFQILKIETDGVPLEGYDDVLKEASSLLVKPAAKVTHFYQTDKNGVMFPSRVAVYIRYPTQNPQIFVTKLKIDMDYEKYKFFTVETGHEIIK